MSLAKTHLTTSILLITAAARAAAQTPAPKPVVIAPIEVVATRFPEAPHDVPVSVEIISGADLRARGALNLREALALATGVAIAPGGDAGPASAIPEFWGVTEFDAFLLVVDGIPWGGALNPAVATLDLRDVERIEVLRGPAPVTYGATSFVGVIHVVHSDASAKARSLSAYAGNYRSGGLAAELAIPSFGSWSSRASASFDRQGFKDDRTSYRRGNVLWRTGRTEGDRPTWFTVSATILRQDPASPHPREGVALSSAVPVDANHNPGGAYINENRFALSAGWDRPVFNEMRWGTTASFTHSAQTVFRGFLTAVTNAPDNASGFRENIDVNDVYADTHLSWPWRSKLRFMLGGDLLFANGEAEGATFSYTAPLNGSTAAVVTEPVTLDKDAADRRMFGGVYGSAEWRPTSRITFNGGLRENAVSERHGEAGKSTTHNRLSGSVGALFSLFERGPDHLRVFANFRDTFKPAAFDFSLAEDEEVLEPETSRSYEAGVKGRSMNGLVDWEASVFRMDFSNLVTSTVVGGVPALLNSGKTRFKGFELASDMRLASSVHARATYSFHDGKFVDFVQAFGGTPTQLGGKRFEMSARHLASVGLTLAPEQGIIAHAALNHTGDRYLNKRNTALAKAFTTFDAGIGYRAGRGEFRVDGRNLTDRRDAVSESEFGDAQYYRMPARTVRVGFSTKY